MIKEIDPHRISLVLGVLFIIGLGATAYALYSLQLTQNFAQVWAFLVATSLIGGGSLVLALRYKKEIIVYKERSKETSATDSRTEGSDVNSIDLAEIKRIAQRGGKDTILNGLKAICKQLEAGQGACYLVKNQDDTKWVELTGGYALSLGENTTIKFDLGEGLIGQAAAEARTLYIDEVPDGYMKIASGLGMASPRYLLIVPTKKDDKALGVLEVSTFKPITDAQRKFVEEAAQLLGDKA
jgi:GAF domain-containing protein